MCGVFFLSQKDPSNITCDEFYSYSLLKNFEYDETTEDGLDVFKQSSVTDEGLYFKHDTHELAREVFSFYIYHENQSSTSYRLVINYTSVDYEYVHDDDDNFFSLDNDKCPDESKTKAPYAQTSFMCSAPKTLVPKLPDCAFELKLVYEEYYYYYDEPLVETVKVVFDDNKLYFMKISASIENMSITVRCDLKNKKGECLEIEHYESYYYYDNESELHCYERYDDPNELLPLGSIEYRGEPEDVLCPPDNSTGCKKYISYDSGRVTSYIVNSEGYVVGTDEGGLVLIYGEYIPTVEDFADVFCNGTKLDGPAEIPCTVSPSSYSTSISTSTASYTLSSILIVAVSFLFALF